MTEEEPLNILVIMGSPRKGNTYRACEELREKMQKYRAVDFEYLWLKDADLQPCRGCLSCFSKGEEKCPIHDEALVIRDRLMGADAVIFASPVYGLNVTGLMKNFVDRFSYFFHRPRFFDKKAFLLTTTGFLGHKDVLKYMEMFTGIWGFDVAGRAAVITEGDDHEVLKKKSDAILEKAAKKFSSSLSSNKRKRPGLMNVIIFHGQKGAMSQVMDESPYDYQYWKEKGWLSPGTHYFTDVSVNPVYVMIGIIVEKIARKKMKTN
ncbi:flavodoxin family protein [Methanolacinia paynteri]|uniref:flavodoxin family protein n=1 Tax=Methanolacinia paynteri TaxID=230356 RepID=UPI00064EFFA5|nr:flavodoxin family protein [Methanolacinia paynteri]